MDGRERIPYYSSSRWWLLTLSLSLLLLCTVITASQPQPQRCIHDSTHSCAAEGQETEGGRVSVELQQLLTDRHPDDPLVDVAYLKRAFAKPNDTYICVRLGRLLVGVHYDSESRSWSERWRKQVFSSAVGPASDLPVSGYPWYAGDVQGAEEGDGNDVIIIKADRAMHFLKPNSDFTALETLAPSEGSFDDVFHWQQEGNVLLLGRFYHDAAMTGVFSKLNGVFSFAKVNPQLADAEDDDDDDDEDVSVLLYMNNDLVGLDDVWKSNSSRFSLNFVRQSETKQTFVVITEEFMRFYEFNEDYRLIMTMETALTLNQGFGPIKLFFGNFIKHANQAKPFKDAVILNDLGMFLYEYNAANNNYDLKQIETSLSKQNGWRPSQTETVRVVSGSKGSSSDYITYSGPRGLTSVLFNTTLNEWTPMLDMVQPVYPSQVACLNHSILFTQTLDGIVQWAPLIPSTIILEPLVPGTVVDHDVDNVDFFNYENGTRVESLVRGVGRRGLPERPVLRWAERWPGNVAREAADPVNGNVAFTLPLINVTLTPHLYVQVLGYYDNTRDSSSLLGRGWITNLMQDFVIVDYKESIYPADYEYYINLEGSMALLNFTGLVGDSMNFLVPGSEGNVSYYPEKQMWTYRTERVEKRYGACSSGGDSNAIHWSLGWGIWRGGGSDLEAVSPLPAAWYLCEAHDLSYQQSFAWKYEKDTYKVAETHEIVTNLRIASLSDNTNVVNVNFEYERKKDDEYTKYEPYDPVFQLYNFPSRLWDSYVLTGINTEHKLFQQHLSLQYSRLSNNRVLTSLVQKSAGFQEIPVSFEYSQIEKSVVLKKCTSLNGFSVSYSYEQGHDPAAYPEMTRFPMYPDTSLSTANSYIVKAHVNYLHNTQLLIDTMNVVGTHVAEQLVATARSPIKSFDMRSFEKHLIVLLFNEQGTDICKFHRENDTDPWRRDADVSFVEKNATISVNDGVVTYSVAGQKGVTVLEWSASLQLWTKAFIDSPALERAFMQQTRIFGYAGESLYIFYKNDNTSQWDSKVINLGVSLTECEILNRFNYTADLHDKICDMIKTRDFQVVKNLIFLSNVEEFEKNLQFNGVLLQLDVDYEIHRTDINIYSAKLMGMTKDIDTEMDDKKGVLHLVNVEKSGKIVAHVDSISGEVTDGLNKEEKKQQLEAVNENLAVNLTTSSLVDWSNYTAVLTTQGLIKSDNTILAMSGTAWVDSTVNEKNSVKLGKKFQLVSDDNISFKLVEGGEVTRKSFTTMAAGQMINRYPEYIAYHEKENVVNVIMFADDESVGNERVFKDEKLLFSSGYYSLMTVANTSNAPDISTEKVFIVRPISSIQRKTPKPYAKFMTTRNAVQGRHTGYRRSFQVDTARAIITQTVDIIPAGKQKVSGWIQQSLTMHLLNKSSDTAPPVAFDSDGNPVPMTKRPKEKETEPVNKTIQNLGSREMLWDRSGEWLISNFYPYRLEDDEVDYIGFESYEKTGKWVFDGRHVVRGMSSFSGESFLRLNNTELSRKFTPSNQGETYMATTWVRSKQLLPVGKATAILTAQVTGVSGLKVVNLQGVVKRHSGAWSYLELRVSFETLYNIYMSLQANAHLLQSASASTDLTITLKLKPITNGESVDVDHVRFTPLTLEFSAHVYDFRTSSLTEKIKNNGLIERSIYNQFGQRIASADETGFVEEVLAGSMTGRLLTPAKTTLNQQQPHTEIKITPFNGFLERFDEVAFVRRWKTDSPEAWEVAPYQLWHRAKQWHSISAADKLLHLTSTTLRFEYSLNERNAAIKLVWQGSSLSVTRQQSTVSIVYEDGVKLQVDELPVSGELLVFREQSRAAILLDGVLLIDSAEAIYHEPWSEFQLQVYGYVTIQNLVVVKYPAVQVEYHNEWGDVTQVINIEEEYSALVVQTLYDELGRPAITTKSTRLPYVAGQPLFALQRDFIRNGEYGAEESVWQTGILQGKINDLNPQDEGYSYYRTDYYPNPLNEKRAAGTPGKEFSVAGPFRKKYTSKPGIDFISNMFPVSEGFRQEAEEQPNQSIQVTVYDAKNNMVAKYTRVPGFDHSFSTYEYDEQKRMTKILPPLYHEKMGTASNTHGVYRAGGKYLTEKEYKLQNTYCTFFEFDEEGKLTRRRSPDGGDEGFMYTDEGDLRFLYTYNPQTNATENIAYLKYDANGQIMETGENAKAMSVEQLKSFIHRDFHGDSLKHQSMRFEDSNSDPDLRGKLEYVTTSIDDRMVMDQIIYNDDHEVLSKITVPSGRRAGFSAITMVNKTFVGKKVRSIAYPLTVEGMPLNLIHEYDRIGKLKRLGLPGQTDLFATFTYGSNGDLQKEQYNVANGSFARNFTYDSSGYVQEISEPFLKQVSSFTRTGYGQAGFGDGMIMSTSNYAFWIKTANDASFLVNPERLKGVPFAKLCINYLKSRGFLSNRGLPLKLFIPAQETDIPLLCVGALSYRLAMLLTEGQPAAMYGHCYAYGNYQELVKAKYFSDPESSCATPLQPHVFAEQVPGLTLAQSNDIFNILADNHFIITDKANYNQSFTIGTPGDPYIKADEIETLLKEMATSENEPTANLYSAPIQKLINARIAHNKIITEQEMVEHFASWDLSDSFRPSNKTFAGLVFRNLASRNLIPVQGKIMQCLNDQFVQSLRDYDSFLPDIVRVLYSRFSKTLGASPRDVMSFEIDSNGNHRKFQVGYNHYSFVYEENTNKIETVQLTSIFTSSEVINYTMQHDSKGNVIQAMHRNIVDINYNPVSQRTSSITLQDGKRLFFTYDAKGERTMKQVMDKSGQIVKETYYLRDDQGRVLMDQVVIYHPNPIPDEEILTAYIYGPRGLIGFVRSDNFYSVTTDHIGTVKLITHKGHVVAAYDYLPYGEHVRIYGDDPAVHIAYRYTGQEYDEETGLYNYHARLYDPSIGRFYQPDPQAQYFSPYKYAGNSPVVLFDPDGEFVLLMTMITLAVIGAYLGGASANGSWNPAKWKWNFKTCMQMALGGLAGFTMIGGFAATVAVLTSVGVSLVGAYVATAVIGIGGAYLLGASSGGANPLQWKWKEPEIWSELFGGFGLGSSIIGAVAEIPKVGWKLSDYVANSRFYSLQKFVRYVKPAFVGLSYTTGGAMAYYKAAEANGGNPAFWEWDWGKISTWAGLIGGFDSGSGLPSTFTTKMETITKGWKDRKNILESFKLKSVTKMKNVKTSLTNFKNALYERSMGAVMSYMSGGSSANEIFSNWNWPAFGTYQGVYRSAYTGKDRLAAAMPSVSRAQLSGLLKSARAQIFTSAKSLQVSSKAMLSLSVEFSKSVGESALAPLYRGNEFGSRRIHLNNERNRKLEMDSMNIIMNNVAHLPADDRTIHPVNQHSECSTSLRTSQISTEMCSFSPQSRGELELAEEYVEGGQNAKLIRQLLHKQRVDVYELPEFLLGGMLAYFSESGNSRGHAYVTRMKQFGGDAVQLLIVDTSQQLVTMRTLVIYATGENSADKNQAPLTVDKKKLMAILAESGVADESAVQVKAEVVGVSAKTRKVRLITGRSAKLSEFEHEPQPSGHEMSQLADSSQVSPLMEQLAELNQQRENSHDQLEIVEQLSHSLLTSFASIRKSGTAKNKALKAFLHGVFAMNFSVKYGVEVLASGEGMALIMSKNEFGHRNWNACPITFVFSPDNNSLVAKESQQAGKQSLNMRMGQKTVSEYGIRVTIDTSRSIVTAYLDQITADRGLVSLLSDQPLSKEAIAEAITKLGPRKNMSHYVLGEILGTSDSYIYSTSAMPLIALVKEQNGNWLMVSVSDASNAHLPARITLPPHIHPSYVRSISLVISDGMVQVEGNRGTILDNYRTGATKFVKIDKVNFQSFISLPEAGVSPMEAIVRQIEQKIGKLGKTWANGGEIQSLLEGLLVGGRQVARDNDKQLKVYEVSHKLAVQLINTKSSVPKEEYFSFISTHKVASSDTGREMEAVMRNLADGNDDTIASNSEKVSTEHCAILLTPQGSLAYSILQTTRQQQQKAVHKIAATNVKAKLTLSESSAQRNTTRSSRSVGHADESSRFTRRRVLEWYSQSSSSAARPELWPVAFIKSVFSTLYVMWNSVPNVGSKRDINKMLKQQEFSQSKMKSGEYFSVLDLGDAWLAETNLQGNLLWLTIAMHKLTGIRPNNIADPFNLRSEQQMQHMRLLAHELTYDVQESLCEAGGKCGITPVVRRVLQGVDMARLSDAVYGKMIKGQVDQVPQLLYSHLLADTLDNIATLTTRRQADKFLGLVMSSP